MWFCPWEYNRKTFELAVRASSLGPREHVLEALVQELDVCRNDVETV